MEHIKHKDSLIPMIGFGTWTIGDDPKKLHDEIETMLYGIDNLSMTLIDVAEMYGSANTVKEVIKQTDRNKLFIIDKILPSSAYKGNYVDTCKKSLQLLGTDYLDLYLLHWRSDVDLENMIEEMENLISLNLIKNWGVSNFDVEDMEELFSYKKGCNCFCNQVLYNVAIRGPEYDLIPWCKNHDVLFMAYSPLFNNKQNRESITRNNTFINLAKKENMTPEALMLNFVIRNKDIITAFKTSNIELLINNTHNVFNQISDDTLKEIDKIFPAPKKKIDLVKI